MYEDVAQLMLNDNLGSQSSRRKLDMVGTSQPTQTRVSKENKENDQNDGEEEEGGYTLLGPNDMSKTFIEMGDGVQGPNCSAIVTNQVQKF